MTTHLTASRSLCPRLATRPRAASLALGLLAATLAAGCCCDSSCGGGRGLFERRAARRSMALYQENQQLLSQLGDAQLLAQSAETEKGHLAAQLGEMQSSLSIAEQRVANLQTERDQMHAQYRDLLAQQQGGSPLPAGSTSRFEELARKYPQFEFDPSTGVSKFGADLLFSSGSDQVKKQAQSLLSEFADIMNESQTRPFNILVVGHTDDEAIKHPVLRDRHATNWELSSHRATQVVRTLAKYGVAERRMGAAGYSKYQPVVANVDETTRQQNRRVEIFVLAPDASVAGFDPGGPRTF